MKRLRAVPQEHILRSAHDYLRRTKKFSGVPLWSFVGSLTGNGATYSAEICLELGWDPCARATSELPPQDAGRAPIENGSNAIGERNEEAEP